MYIPETINRFNTQSGGAHMMYSLCIVHARALSPKISFTSTIATLQIKSKSTNHSTVLHLAHWTSTVRRLLEFRCFSSRPCNAARRRSMTSRSPSDLSTIGGGRAGPKCHFVIRPRAALAIKLEIAALFNQNRESEKTFSTFQFEF